MSEQQVNKPNTNTNTNGQFATLCSEWCYIQWEAAISKGDTQAANNYMKLYELWKERGQ